MRSWAFLILEAATISMALVILRVFCTLLILVRISLLPAMSVRRVLLEVFDGVVELRLVFLRQVLGLLDAADEVAVLALREIAERALGGERLGNGHVVEVAVVHRE